MTVASRNRRRVDWARVVTTALGVLAGIVAAAGTLAVATAGFTLSYDATRKVGIASGIRLGWAWLLPVSVDGAIAVATVTAVVMSRLNRRPAYPWLVVTAGAMISIACNAVHAQMREVIQLGDRTAMAVSAIPAVMLVLSVHLLVTLVEAVTDATRARHKPVTAAATAPATPGPASVATLPEYLATDSARPPVAPATITATRPATASVAPATITATDGATPPATPSVAPATDLATRPATVAAEAATGPEPAPATGVATASVAPATDDRDGELYAIVKPLVESATDGGPAQRAVYDAIKERTGKGAGFKKIAALIERAEREAAVLAKPGGGEPRTNGHAAPDLVAAATGGDPT